MSLAKYIPEKCVDLELDIYLEEIEDENPNKKLWRGKEAVLQALVSLLDTSGNIRNCRRLFNDLLNREKKATTGLGNGFALPHVRTIEAKSLTMALARYREGIEFDAIDGQPVYLFLAMVAPSHDDTLYLRIYKEIADGISQGLYEELMEAQHMGEVYRALKRF